MDSIGETLYALYIGLLRNILSFLTTVSYVACIAMLVFWIGVTNWLVGDPSNRWNEFYEKITQNTDTTFLTLMAVNPFVLVLVCTIAIVLTIWCQCMFFMFPKNKKNAEE